MRVRLNLLSLWANKHFPVAFCSPPIQLQKMAYLFFSSLFTLLCCVLQILIFPVVLNCIWTKSALKLYYCFWNDLSKHDSTS